MDGATLTSRGGVALTGQNTPNSPHSDVIAKAFTVFSLPGSNKSSRLDLIFSVPEAYWTAVVGWWVCSYVARSVSDIDGGTPRTGSTMFQRDLRLFAKTK